jgi:hypothetical protein
LFRVWAALAPKLSATPVNTATTQINRFGQRTRPGAASADTDTFSII